MPLQRMMILGLIMVGMVSQVTAVVCGQDITEWAKKLATEYPYVDEVKTPNWPITAQAKLLAMIPPPRTNSDIEREIIKQILIKAYNFAVIDSEDIRLTVPVKAPITALAQKLAGRCAIGVGWSEKIWMMLAGQEFDQMERFGLEKAFIFHRVLAQALVLAQAQCAAVQGPAVANVCGTS